MIQLTGQVSVMRNNDLWALLPNDAVSPGQEIISGPDGHAVLELQDTSRVEIFPNSRVQFRANYGNLRDLLDLVLGKIRIHIEKIGGKPNPYRISSPTALIAVRGTTFEVEASAPGATTVSVEEGSVDVWNRISPGTGKPTNLKDGDSLTVYANQPLAQSHVDRWQKVADTAVRAVDQAIRIMQTVNQSKVPGTAGAGGTTTPGSSTTPGTVNPPTSAGSGNGTPPTNGRPGTGTPGGDTGPGSSTGPTTGGPTTGTPGSGTPGGTTGGTTGGNSAGSGTQSTARVTPGVTKSRGSN